MNKKLLFLTGVAVLVVWLWGVKGFTEFLPGPD